MGLVIVVAAQVSLWSFREFGVNVPARHCLVVSLYFLFFRSPSFPFYITELFCFYGLKFCFKLKYGDFFPSSCVVMISPSFLMEVKTKIPNLCCFLFQYHLY